MEPAEYEKNLQVLRKGEEGKRFLPFYRNYLKPILQYGLFSAIKDEKDERNLLAAGQYAKLIDDIEIIMKRIIVSGENAEKVLRETLKGGKTA